LAQSYEVSADHKSITLKIRQGVKFHDASDLNAAAVKWNLEQVMPKNGVPMAGGANATTWTSVEVVDDYTVKVNLSSWSSQTLTAFADTSPAVVMISKAAYEKNGVAWMRKNPVGTGAFKFVSYRMDSSLKMVKFDDYWAKDDNGNKLPYLDGIEYIIADDKTVQRSAIQAGEADMVGTADLGKPAADYASLGLKIDAYMDANDVLVPDSAHASSPWSKQEVREAAEYAIDREQLAKNFGYGYWKAPYQIPSRGSAAFNNNFTLGRKYDLQKAKQLMAQAGYSNGFKTTLVAFPGISKDVVLAVQYNLAQIGITAELKFPDMGSFVGQYGPGSSWQNTVMFMPDPQNDATFLGGLTFAWSMWGGNWAKPADLQAAYKAAVSSPTNDVGLVRAATDLITKYALAIPVVEAGLGRAEYKYVVADFGQRGTPRFYSWERIWLNK
jgi:ABC-type transport system substrate-binding protein